ncbi:E3 ubiquitin-protein ligase RNF115-like [Hyposmocoma kahamanoa]|uniref:E3 ubiquitin-protein ligase RNF115-like n=1 Tax=Hyposmocoma kahamanoa TaxID=1477025 RepID=UPI000E6DA216|nr:E3 ubiquitin-protein ligase RNF115-like [Hyposmocoma kahamanoa]
MADALVERRPPARFFCHRCNVEFEDVLQDYTCPYCASGFIEQLENEAEAPASGDDFSDADMSNLDDMSTIDEMSNLDDSDDMHQSTPPMLNDLAFLMSGGRLRGAGRRETLMEQLVWMIGGARPGTGAVAAGAPFVLVGAPGDYVFGGEGLDAVVTQLLGQLENAGPPPLPRDQIAAIPNEPVTAEQAATNTSCSVCWEAFTIGETISRLDCGHIFHSTCISPWLQLHATCPICRRSLLPAAPADAEPPPSDSSAPSDTSTSTYSAFAPRRFEPVFGCGILWPLFRLYFWLHTRWTSLTPHRSTSARGGSVRGGRRGRSVWRLVAASLARAVLRGAGEPARRPRRWAGASSSSSSAFSAATGAPRSSSSSSSSTSSLDSARSSERDADASPHSRYNMDIDFD